MHFSFPGTENREGPIRILFVCTGNICRSPLAELMMRHELGELPVVVSSAGTHALVGHKMMEQNQRIAEANGVEDATSHRARQLTRDMVADSDLVLALSREHRREVVNLVPRASRFVFTLREFGRLALSSLNQPTATIQEKMMLDGMRGAIRNTIKLRGTLALLDDPQDDDVVDPYRKEESVYVQSAEQLVPSILNITSLLRDSATGVK